MVQTLQTVSTFFNSGWAVVGAASAHLALDEGVDTNDGNTSLVVTGGASNWFGIRFPQPSGPLSTSGWKVRFSHRAAGSGTPFDYTLVISNGVGVLGAAVIPAPPKQAAYVTVEVELDEATAQAILDFGSNWIVVPTLGPTQDGAQYIITAIEVVTPDVTVEERLTQYAVETLRSAETLSELAITRLSGEVLLSRSVQLAITRMSGEVLYSPEQNRSVENRLTQLAVEAIRARSTTGGRDALRVSRLSGEVLYSSANQILFISRLSGEVLMDAPVVSEHRMTRFTVEAIRALPTDTAVRMTRFSGELMIRRTIANFVRPLPATLGFYPFVAANWRTPVTIETEYSTDVQLTRTGAREKTSLLKKPIRTQNAEISALRQGYRFLAYLQARSTERHPIPIYSDFTRTTASVIVSKTIPCDTNYRRFFLNQRVLIVTQTETLYRQIVAIGGAALEVDTEVTLPKKAVVYPLMDCEIELDNEVEKISDDVFTGDLTFTEVMGPSGLPGSPIESYDTFEGTPIFNVNESWNVSTSISFSGIGQTDNVGKGIIVQVTGDRPSLNYEMSFQFKRRANWWTLYQWFCYFKGRYRSAWLIPNVKLFEVIASTSTTLDVSKLDLPLNLVQAIVTHIWIDGTIYEVTGITDETTVFRITIDGSISTPKKVKPAAFVELTEDVMVEEWVSDEHVSTTLTFSQNIDPGHKTLELT